MKCELRAWQRTDAEALAALINNKKIQDCLRDGIPYPYTKADAQSYLEQVLSADPNQTYAFAITANGILVGSIAVYRQSNIHSRTGELGYYIGEPFQGKGIGTEAVGQICRRLLEQTDLLRIFAEPFAYNKASCRVLEKNGFRHEGTLRKNAVKNGKIIDMELYGLTV